MANWDNVKELLDAAAHPYRRGATAELEGDQVFPGAVLYVARGGKELFFEASGCRSLVPDVTPLERSMVFDVASLTKALITTTLVMKFIERGKLKLDQTLSHFFQTFGSHGKETMSVRHLLAHCSGFPAYQPFYKHISSADLGGVRAGIMGSRGAVEYIYNEIYRSKLEHVPGKVANYSDIGFILLGNVLEVVSGGKSIDKLALEEIIKPLRLANTGFVDLSKTKQHQLEPVTEMIVPTADCPWRQKILCGEVHDDNAWAMGGIAGHAGLFSNAEDVHTIAAELIECYHGRGELLKRETVRSFWKRDETVKESTWALGWDTPTAGASSSGKLFSANSVGHLGYTGCSIWIDPDRELDLILLSNRVHPNAKCERIKEFRPVLHDMVMEAAGYAR